MKFQSRDALKKSGGNSKAKRRNAIVKHSCARKSSAKNELPDEPARGSRASSAERDWRAPDDGEARAKHHDWESLAEVLGNDGSLDSSVLALIAKDFCTGYILHEAILLGAPDAVLMLLVNRFPVLLTQVDGNGRYPVHVACAVGASSEFVFHCIDKNPSSAAARDVEGKTPIHLLCQGGWSGAWGGEINSAVEKNMKEIIWMLYQKAPSSVTSEDDYGIGSIEYAIESYLGIKIILLLQEIIGNHKENEARKGDQPKHCMTTLHQ